MQTAPRLKAQWQKPQGFTADWCTAIHTARHQKTLVKGCKLHCLPVVPKPWDRAGFPVINSCYGNKVRREVSRDHLARSYSSFKLPFQTINHESWKGQSLKGRDSAMWRVSKSREETQTQKPGVAAHACNPSIQADKAERPWVWGHPWLHACLKANTCELQNPTEDSLV